MSFQKAPKVEKPKKWIVLRSCREGKTPKKRRAGRSIPKCTPEQQARQDAARELGCIACHMLGLRGEQQCGVTQIHHQNLGGNAGQKNLGQDFTVALGSWHHQGWMPPSETKRTMTAAFGPSLAVSSRAFRERFGDDAVQLAYQNDLIGARS